MRRHVEAFVKWLVSLVLTDRKGTEKRRNDMGYAFRGPEGLLIWCSDCGADGGAEAYRLFPWWGKVKPIGPESLEDFAPDWHQRPVPRFLFKEANTGRVIGVIESD